MNAKTALRESDLPALQLIHRGKVRDVYALDASRLLIVATDRLSAFDVVLPDPIPGKGEILTQLSNFWFAATRHMMPNHLLPVTVDEVLPSSIDPGPYRARSVVARRLRALPVEAIVRGRLAGSGWKDYVATGMVSGIPLPAGLQLAERLPEPVFTPSTKAKVGDHDENIPFDKMVETIGGALSEQIRSASLAIYNFAAEYAAARGILIADTKFEFGIDDEGVLYVIDEMLTPDSSRFWPADEYRIGTSPPSYDKQFVRDWLETQAWDKRPPGPHLPESVIAGTAARYAEALARLTSPAPS